MRNLKTLSLILACLVCLAACTNLGGKTHESKTAADPRTQTVTPTTGSNGKPATTAKTVETASTTMDETETATTTEDESQTSGETTVGDIGTPNLDGTWSSLYEAYADRLGKHTEAITEAMGEANPMLGLYAIQFISGDIELALTAAFFGEQAAAVMPSVLAVFGHKNVAYKQVGDKATVTFEDSEGAKGEFSLRFDGRNTAELTWSKADKPVSLMSICVTDDYMAKSYTNLEKGNLVYLVGWKNGDVSVGIDEKGEAPNLYMHADAPARSDLVASFKDKLFLKDGKFSTTIK